MSDLTRRTLSVKLRAMSHVLTAAEQVGRQVQVAMVEQGKTQDDVGLAVGLSHAAVSRRLHGHVSFRVDELIVVAAVLGVDPARFLRPIPQSRPAPAPVDRVVGAA